MTGAVSVEPGCLTAFEELRAKRTVNTVVCRLDADEQTVRCAFEGNLTHDELIAALPVDGPCSVVHHLAFARPDGTRKSAVLLISWCPTGVPEPVAAAHETAHGELMALFDGVDVHLRAACPADLAYAALVERAVAG
jgi:cofilin